MPEYGDYELHSADSIYQEGMDLLESDHFEEALRAFEFVVHEQPYNADAFFHKAVALSNLNRLEEALASFRVALKLAPTEALYHSHCGYTLMLCGKLDQALEHFDYALGLEPDSYHNKLYKAHVLKEKRRYVEARQLLDSLVDERPDDIDILRQHASLLAEIGEESQALEELQSLLRKNPNDTESIRRKGEILMRRGNLLEAIKSLREYLALCPTDRGALYTLLEALSAMGKWIAVIAHAGEAFENGLETAEIYTYRGRAMMEEHRLNQAVQDLRRACQLDPQSLHAHSLLAHALMAQGSLREALLCIDRALKIAPTDRHCLLIKSLLHHKLGEYHLELECLDSQLEENPRDYHLVRRKAETLIIAGSPDKARMALEQFLGLEPNDLRALLFCAELSEQLEDYDRAQSCFDTLMAHPPVSVRVYLAHASFLLRRTQGEKALAILEKATEDLPEETILHSARAAALQTLERHEECVQYLQEMIGAGKSTSQLHWQLGKSLYALGQYKQALEWFKQARSLDTRCNGNLAPTFRLLVDEAYTLHHLKRTWEAIRLLESHFSQFQRFEQEYHEILGELYEGCGAFAKAQLIYARGLEKFPGNALLHYRLARAWAALRKKRRALDHLRQALTLDSSLSPTAETDPAFQRYWRSLSMNRLLRFRPMKRRIKILGVLGVWISLIFILCYALLRPQP